MPQTNIVTAPDLPTIPDVSSYSPGIEVNQMMGQTLTPDSGVPQLSLYKPDYTNKTDGLVNQLRASAMQSLMGVGEQNDTLSKIIKADNKKVNLSGGYANQHDVYDTLSDGVSLIPKYEKYMKGVNNEVYNASFQTDSEKRWNPFKRTVTKFVPNVLGGIASFVHGVGEAALTGRAEALFDNATANMLDDWGKKVDFDYKNYYTEEQNGLGFNNYTWDKAMGGVDFTIQMIGAEAVIAAATGGASLPASFARLGAKGAVSAGLGGTRMASKLSRIAEASDIARNTARVTGEAENIRKTGNFLSRSWSELTKPLRTVATQGKLVNTSDRVEDFTNAVNKWGKLGENLKMARFAVTGSSYEAGFEARHYQKEAEDAFWNHYRGKGETPSKEDVDKFYSKLTDTAWTVFGSNMAILSTSNLAVFGTMMNIKNPFARGIGTSFVEKNIFRQGTEKLADGSWKALNANFLNKTAAYVSPFVKSGLIEGVYEEGSQGIASGMMKNYIASTYDPKAMRETLDYSSAFTKALKDQFSTKEGIEEIAIGAIVGGLFGGGGKILGTGQTTVGQDYKKQERTAEVQNSMESYAEEFLKNNYTNENWSNIIGHANRLQSIEERVNQSETKGDTLGTALYSAEGLISMLQASHSVGKEGQFLEMLTASLKGMDNAQLAQGQTLTEGEVEAFKADQISGLEKLGDTYAKSRKAAQYLFGNGQIGGFYDVDGKQMNQQNLVDAFAYSSTMGVVAEQLALDSFNGFQTKLAEVFTNRETLETVGVLGALKMASLTANTEYSQVTNELSAKLKQRVKLEGQIMQLQKSEDKVTAASKIEKIQTELLSLNNEIVELSRTKDLKWSAITDNFYKKLGKTGSLPQIQDLEKFNEKVKEIQKTLESSDVELGDKQELSKMFNVFNQANEAFNSFHEMYKNLADPKFTYKTYNGIFSKTRAKRASLNELTKETLLSISGTKMMDGVATFKPVESLITEDIAKNATEEENYVLDDSLKEFLKNKLKNNKPLTENEKKVYNKYKGEVDLFDLQDPEPLNSTSKDTEIDSTKVKLRSKRKELKNLIEKGIYTLRLKVKINGIKSQMEKFHGELNEIYKEGSSIMYKDQDYTISTVNRNIGNSIYSIELSDENGNITTITDLSTLSADSAIYNDSINTLGAEIEYLEAEILANPSASEITHKDTVYSRKDDGSWTFVNKKGTVSKVGLPSILNILNTAYGKAEATESNKKLLVEKQQELIAEINKEKGNRNRIELSLTEGHRIMQDMIEEEKFLLDEEISTLQGEETLEKKEARLQNRIDKLESQIREEYDDMDILEVKKDQSLDKSHPNYARIKRLRKLKNQMLEIRDMKEDYNPDATLVERLQWVVDNINSLSFDNVNDLADVQMATQDEVVEYTVLSKKRKKTEQDNQRLSDLRDKMLPFHLVEGTELDGQNLMELIELYNQMKESQELSEIKENQITETTLQEIVKTTVNPTSSMEYRTPDVGLVYDGAYIQVRGTHSTLHHIKLDTMLTKAIEKGYSPTIVVFETDKSGKRTEKETIQIDVDNALAMGKQYDNVQNITVNIDENLYLKKTEKQPYFNVNGKGLAEMLDIKPYTIMGVTTGYNLFFKENVDGTWSSMESEFVVSIDGVVQQFDKKVLNEIKPGDEVTLEYNSNDDYNKTLKPKDAAVKGNIYVKKNGKLVNILKSTNGATADKEKWDDLQVTREMVYEASKKNGTVKIKINDSYIGFPVLTINNDGKLKEHKIDDSAVVSYGYINEEGKEVYFNSKTKVDNNQYLKYHSDNKLKTPIVAFKSNGKVYAFPITIKPKGLDISGQLDNITSDNALTEEQMMFKVNALLQQYDMMSPDIMLGDNNKDIDKVRTALESATQNVDITDPKAVKEADKATFIDLNDAWMSSKLVFNLKSAEAEVKEAAKASKPAPKKTPATGKPATKTASKTATKPATEPATKPAKEPAVKEAPVKEPVSKTTPKKVVKNTDKKKTGKENTCKKGN